MKWKNEKYFKIIEDLTKAADLIVDIEDGNRHPMVFIIRSLRTIINPYADNVIEYTNNKELLYEVIQMCIEFVIKTDVTAKWIASRNNCIPAITKEEYDSIERLLVEIKDKNKEFMN